MHLFSPIFVFSFLLSMPLTNTHTEFSKAEPKTEVYKSTDDSFRTDYYLIFDDQQVTLIGWDSTFNHEVVYFKSTSTVATYKDESLHISFEKFEISKTPINQDNWNTFTPDSTIDGTQFLFFSSFFNGTRSGNQIDFLAVKHSYCSRADHFAFEKI